MFMSDFFNKSNTTSYFTTVTAYSNLYIFEYSCIFAENLK